MSVAADITRAERQATSFGLSSVLLGLCFAVACAAPFVLNGYGLYLLTLTGVFALVALGLNLLTGYAGQISLCHAAFFGVGAYATAILTQKVGLPYLLSILVGGLLTACVGAVVAVPAMRLKSLYLAIATLGFGVVLQKIIFEWRGLTNGGGGLALSPPAIAGYELGATGLYYLTLALVTLGIWGAWNVSRGRTGRALLIIKESEIAAGALGIPAARYKVIAFAISAFYAAVAGGLFAYLVRYINPENFSVGLSIAFLSMVVIGGLGTIGGSIVGRRLLRHRSRALARHQGCARPRVRPAAGHRDGAHAAGPVGTGTPSRAEDVRMARLSIENVSVDFGGIHALRDVSFELETGRDRRTDRPERRRQEHAAQLHLRHHAADPGPGAARRCRSFRAAAGDRGARCGIGRVFQHPELVADLSVHENLLIACHRSLDYGLVGELLRLPDVAAAGARGGATGRRACSHGLVCPDSAELAIRNLPYGHRKLVDLGRALLMDIRFLLLDEPIAGLNDAEIATLRRSAARAATGIGPRHSRRRAQHAVRVAVSAIGWSCSTSASSIANGPPADVLRDPQGDGLLSRRGRLMLEMRQSQRALRGGRSLARRFDQGRAGQPRRHSRRQRRGQVDACCGRSAASCGRPRAAIALLGEAIGGLEPGRDRAARRLACAGGAGHLPGPDGERKPR